ncbi:MAG: 3-ketoacyl-CoA thiolase [Candidatus Riflebacteria bacterium]|nr:3-ketoacyl-CoA thiolase [Candidatus Riflebacteria bacterium]
MTRKFPKDVFITAGFNTISLGSGRKEFNPKKPRPGIAQYVAEAGKGAVKQINSPANIDECVVANFMAGRFVHQGHLGAFAALIDDSLEYKPSTRVEGACCSGGLGLVASMKNVLSGLSDVSMTVGIEVQNSVKAIYGADILAGAGYYDGTRKDGHAFYFPSLFADKAKAFYQKYGEEKARKAMATWYANAIQNARLCPEAQENHNTDPDPFSTGMTPPNPKAFLDGINVFDCSKVSDGGSAIILATREGLKKIGKSEKDSVQIAGYGHCVADITKVASDLTCLETTRRAVEQAYAMAGVTPADIGIFECHDCFTITGLLSLEAAGFCTAGKSTEFVIDGKSRRDGILPTNSSGGLIGFGHYTGGTGVRQAVDILRHLTGTAGTYQVAVDPKRPYGLMISMGGNDRTVVAFVFKKVA